MPTTSVNAALKYWPGGVSGQARQGVYNGQNYSGTLTFDFSSIGALDNIDITSITLSFHVGALGGAYTKYLYLKKGATNGTAIGSYKFTGCYDANKSITFSASSNTGGFNTIKEYIEGISSGGTVILGIQNTGGSRGSGSGKSYDYDYMAITSASMSLTYSYKRSRGSIGSASTGSSATLTITAYNSSYSHKVTWKLGSWSSGAQSVAAGTTSASYTIPHSALPNSTSGTATVTLETLNGSSSLGSNTYSFNVSVPSSIVPSIGSLTTTLVNSGASSTAFGWGEYIQNKTKCTATMGSVSAGSGATIKSYSITTNPNCGSGSSSSLTTSVLSKSGTVTFTAKVTDSRGRTATKTTSITVRQYMPPQITSTPDIYRCTSGGTRDDVEGTYANLTVTYSYYLVNNNNSLSIRRVSLNGVNTNISSGTAVTIGAGALQVDKSYKATITLKDVVGEETTYVVDIPSAAYIIHVHKGGNSLGIGRAANTIGDNRVHVGWAATFYDDMSVNGALAARGGTSVTGNITATGTLITNGNNYIKRTDINGKSATNGISSNLYPGIFTRDNNDEWTSAFRGIAYTDGSFASNLAVRNYVSSAWSEKTALSCRYYKDGSVEYTVQSTAFRKALGLGSSGTLPITVGQGGTNATTALGARTNLQAALGKYTSGEVDTGCTWVDGKEIYRYVWTGSKTINGSQVEMFTMSVTPVKILDIRGIRTRSSGNSWPIPYSYYNNQNWDMGIYYDSSDKKVYVNAGSGYGSTSDSFIIILEYTKS